MRRALQILIRGYQFTLSPLLGQSCRFHPSCSHYAHEAIGRFGAIKGSGLAAHRLLRCHPWAEGGFDPVPDATAPAMKPAKNATA